MPHPMDMIGVCVCPKHQREYYETEHCPDCTMLPQTPVAREHSLRGLAEADAGETGGSAMPLPLPEAVYMDLVRGPEGWRIRQWRTEPFPTGVRYERRDS